MKVPCNFLENKKVCGKVTCKDNHKIPGTEDPSKGSYFCVQKGSKQLAVQLDQSQNEYVLNSSKAKMDGKDLLILLTSLNNLIFVDLQQM